MRNRRLSQISAQKARARRMNRLKKRGRLEPYINEVKWRMGAWMDHWLKKIADCSPKPGSEENINE